MVDKKFQNCLDLVKMGLERSMQIYCENVDE